MPPPRLLVRWQQPLSTVAIALACDCSGLPPTIQRNEPSMSRLLSRACILSLLFIAGSYLVAASGADAPLRTAKDSASEWPQWRGPNRDGISPDTGLLQDWNAKQPKLLWTAEGLGGGYASVSVAGGRIYTTGNQPAGQAVICLNAANGKVLWKHSIT